MNKTYLWIVVLFLGLNFSCSMQEEINPQVSEIIEPISASASTSSSLFSSKKYWMFHKANSEVKTKMSHASNTSNWAIYDKIDNSGSNGGGIASYVAGNNVFLMYGKKTNNNVKLKYASNPDSWQEAANPFEQMQAYGGFKVVEWNGSYHVIFHGYDCTSSVDNCLNEARWRKDDAIYYSSSSDGFNWSTPSKIWALNPYFNEGDPSLTVFNNKLYAFRTNRDQEILIKEKASLGSSWSNENTIQNTGAVSDVSAETFNNKLFLFFHNSSGKIYSINSSNGSSWSTPIKIPNEGGETRVNIATLVDGGNLLISYIGENSNNVVVRHSTDGQNWSGKIKFDSNKGRGSISLLNTSGIGN